MKLLTRTNLYIIGFSLFIFIIGGFVFSNLLYKIFNDQINQEMFTEMKLIEEAIEQSDSIPDFYSVYGHMVDIKACDTVKSRNELLHDTILYDATSDKFRLFRHLAIQDITTDKRRYSVSLLKPLDEKNKITNSLILVMGFIFLTLLIIPAFINYYVLRGTWRPFYHTLGALDKYNIQSGKSLSLSSTRVTEFRMLNSVLTKMADKIYHDYVSLKEFNENAAHELQTPLAVIQSKVDLLIQSEQLTDEHLRLINSITEAVTRISRLTHGLLLISRIENNQFSELDDVCPKAIIEKILENMEELIGFRKISVVTHLHEGSTVRMNRDLAEILISNLISNAVKHNIENGSLQIVLKTGSLVISNTGPELKTNPALLFERFRKSSRAKDSIGLGLAIVKKITDLYGIGLEYRYENSVHFLILKF